MCSVVYVLLFPVWCGVVWCTSYYSLLLLKHAYYPSGLITLVGEERADRLIVNTVCFDIRKTLHSFQGRRLNIPFIIFINANMSV